MQRKDYSLEVYPCEAPGCTRRRTLREMHSIAIVYRKPGLDALTQDIHLTGYQCTGKEGEEQHLGCCHEHAMLAALKCLFVCTEYGPHAHPKLDAYHDEHLEQIAQIILPKQVSSDALLVYQQREEEQRQAETARLAAEQAERERHIAERKEQEDRAFAERVAIEAARQARLKQQVDEQDTIELPIVQGV